MQRNSGKHPRASRSAMRQRLGQNKCPRQRGGQGLYSPPEKAQKAYDLNGKELQEAIVWMNGMRRGNPHAPSSGRH